MPIFTSTYINRIDQKGRVSVPAAFRSQMAAMNFQGVYAFRGRHLPMIDVWAEDELATQAAQLSQLPHFSEERQILQMFFGSVTAVPFDGEGRIVVPPALLKHAGIVKSVAFVGGGATFQIWDPDALETHQGLMLDLMEERKLTFPMPQGRTAP